MRRGRVVAGRRRVGERRGRTHGARRRESGDRVDEVGDRRVGGDHGVDLETAKVLPSARLVGIEHAEDAAAGSVDRVDERSGQAGPPVADDEGVVLVLEREGRVEHDLAHARAAVVGEVAMETLHPRFR